MYKRPYGDLAILALDSLREFGNRVNDVLIERYKNNEDFDHHEETPPESFIVPVDTVRFSNGEGKVMLPETVRGKDVFILCDPGNYSCTYKNHGFVNHMGPDEHFADIKRTVSAIAGKSRRISVIMPLLYASRQHKRKSRESLDCALALQELESMGVKDIITFDVHNASVQNSVPLASFENFYPTYDIIKALINCHRDAVKNGNLVVIAPDTGAMDRAIYYASVLGANVGVFYKRRDYTKIVKGSNPIIEHEYMGPDLKGKNALIVDDLISSGESMFDVMEQLHCMSVNKVCCAVTFALFTSGMEKFKEYHARGMFNSIFSTNLTYVPDEVKSLPWYIDVDMVSFVAKIVDYYNFGRSVAPILDQPKDMTAVIKNLGRVHTTKCADL